jgi:dephospho-CoA kinase
VSTTRDFEVWGLTGGVASGKSQVARIFSEAGIPVLDADLVARQLSQPGGAAYDDIVAHFGTADRGRLREIVFKDLDARRDLEAILHPRIQAESMRQMSLLAKAATRPGKKTPVIYEAALLVETGRYKDLDGLLVVEAPAEVRAKRLQGRDGSSVEVAGQIIAAQTTDALRKAAATHVISNTGSLDDLRQTVQAWIAQAGW